MTMPKVSVIIPVYNVGRYIERCLHTLFGQTLDDMEYIFVDDASTDGSASKISEVLECSYPHRKGQVRMLRHETNRGVAAARAAGIRAATGDYIIHCDPDDYVERDMCEKMYARAAESDADIVACRYFEESEGRCETVRRDYAPTPRECLERICRRNCHCSRLWDKLVRRTLVSEHDIVPCEGCDYAEDLDCVVRMFRYASSLAVVESPLYHYCRRADSATLKVRDDDFLNMRLRSTERICGFLEEEGFPEVSRQIRFYAKMECRSLFRGREDEWYDLWRDTHGSIMHCDDMPLRVRIFWRLSLLNRAAYRAARYVFPTIR